MSDMKELRDLYNQKKEQNRKSVEANSFYKGKLAEKSANMISRFEEAVKAIEAIKDPEMRQVAQSKMIAAMDETKFEDMAFLKLVKEHSDATSLYLRDQCFSVLNSK